MATSVRFALLFLAAASAPGLAQLTTLPSFSGNTLESGLQYADGRINGGSDTGIQSYPYQASVERNFKRICGGSIIDANYILTVAHCVVLISTYNVRVGTSWDSRGGSVVNVTKTIVHDKFLAPLYDYDVALLRLAQPLTFSEEVQPVALAQQDEQFPGGTPSVATGWGTLVETGLAAPTLQAVEMSLLTNADCEKYYPLNLTSRMICAGSTQSGRDACQGDPGGPLVESGGKQVGIVSWGSGCASGSSPGVFVRVAAFRDWIALKIGI